ncbi:MAG TPA: DUF1801 domain-containing protein [Thermoplasmata archaeon]|nr:DUF1801 domain-containing protein [Thermoplasmata archaeon]
MLERLPSGMPAKKDVKGFSEAERAAMREYVRETRARARGAEEDPETIVLAKIAAMPAGDRAIAERIHALVKKSAPGLTPRTWYGMPAYAKDGQVVCFFQPASKFKARYQTLGFSDEAKLDDGRMWPVVYAITELTPAEESRIAALVRKAAG